MRHSHRLKINICVNVLHVLQNSWSKMEKGGEKYDCNSRDYDQLVSFNFVYLNDWNDKTSEIEAKDMNGLFSY